MRRRAGRAGTPPFDALDVIRLALTPRPWLDGAQVVRAFGYTRERWLEHGWQVVARARELGRDPRDLTAVRTWGMPNPAPSDGIPGDQP